MLQTFRAQDRLTVLLEGELDHYCASGVHLQLDRLLADPTIRCLEFDMRALTFMDSSGIGVILGRYRILRDRGGTVEVSHMNPHIARIFRMSGMDRLIRDLDRA